jgi:nucleotide-binding universal stress UspA family protein
MERAMYKKILLPTDGSEISFEAVEHAVALARLCHAFLHIVYVRESYPYANIDAAHSAGREDYEAAAQRRAHDALSQAEMQASEPDVTVTTECIDGASAAEGIIEAARRQNADLIVMASHGRSGVERMLLGSVAQKVLALADMPVLIVR